MKFPEKGKMVVIDTNGTQSTVILEPMNIRLTQFQTILGGYFQIIPYTQTCSFLINEDGVGKKLPKNFFFTNFYGNVCVINNTDL